MTEQDIFWGISEVMWQGIFGFISTIIVAGAVGFITITWLSKQEALNQLEGKVLDNRITAYLGILDSMARINERTVILDTEFSIRDELAMYGIITLRDRPAVEYPPIFENRKELQNTIKKLDDFHTNGLQLLDSKSYKQFMYVYLYFSKLDGYYKYLMNTPLPNGEFLNETVTDSILKDFLPKLGMVIDFDMVKMQVDFERTLVRELYKLRSLKKPPFKDEAGMIEFFYLKLSETFYLVNEMSLFKMLVAMTAKKVGIPVEILSNYFKPNDYVITSFLYDEEVE